MNEPASDRNRRPRAGFPFLLCGIAFAGVGLATHQTAFLAIGPAFVVIGIAFLARARRAAHPPSR